MNVNERPCANEQSFVACLSDGITGLALEQHVYTLCLCGVAKATGLPALLREDGGGAETPRMERRKKCKEIKLQWQLYR